MRLALLLIGLLSACAPAAVRIAEPTRPTTASPAGPEIHDFFRIYFQAVEARDLEAFMALIDEDVVIRWPGGAPITDHARLRQAVSAVFARVSQEIEWRILDGAVSRDWAWARVRERTTHTPTAGGEPRTFEGSHLIILRRRDGVWRLHRDYSALDPPQ